MKLKAEQLGRQLGSGLAPVYLIAGDEPLLVEEARARVLRAARLQGFDERIVLDADKKFDWLEFIAAGQSMSLFAQRQILDVRLSGGKPTDPVRDLLERLLSAPIGDTLVIMTGGKLDGATLRTKWVKLIEQQGVFVQVWPVGADRMPQWVMQRAKALKLSLDADVADLIVERTEGNLLAAKQELEKLKLLHGESRLTLEQVYAEVADSARFSVFSLLDAALEGDVKRAVRGVVRLREEGIELPIILWALTRDLRALHSMRSALATGLSIGELFRKFKIWPARQGVYTQVMRRLSLEDIKALLARCARVDRATKGVETGDPWLDVFHIVQVLSGARTSALNKVC